MSDIFGQNGEPRKLDHDPLISGLEPEPFQQVFQQLFTGITNYITPDEPEEADGEKKEDEQPFPQIQEQEPMLGQIQIDPIQPIALVDQDENRPTTTHTIAPLSIPSIYAPLFPPTHDSNAKTRQYPMFRCGMCSDTFVSEVTLEYHETKMHSEMFQWSCYYCNVRFCNFRQAGEHSRLFHDAMPVNDLSHHEIRKKGLSIFMQEVTKRSSEFVKRYLQSRDKRTIMTTAYFSFAKCELKAVYTGNIGLVLYHQAKTDLLNTHNMLDHEDFVACMKRNFIYGNSIQRTPYDCYIPYTVVYRTLTFYSSPKNAVRRPPGAGRPGRTLRDVVSRYAPQRNVVPRPQYRVAVPYQGRRYVREVPQNLYPPVAAPNNLHHQEQEDELFNRQ